MALASSRSAFRATTTWLSSTTSSVSGSLVAIPPTPAACPHRTLPPLLRRNFSRGATKRIGEHDRDFIDADTFIPAPLPPRSRRNPAAPPAGETRPPQANTFRPTLGDITDNRPRWSHTPEAMKGPFNPTASEDPRHALWAVNNDPGLLDEMYVRLLGREGPNMLEEEIKWLAVTHKSFDLGRRGFNDKLAYFGRTALVTECAQWISSSTPKTGSLVPDQYQRTPFQHRALEMCDNLNVHKPMDIISLEKIQGLAFQVGLDRVLRWQPRDPDKLGESGLKIVINSAIYAIVGAVWLQNGAEVGGRVVRDRILKKVFVSAS